MKATRTSSCVASTRDPPVESNAIVRVYQVPIAKRSKVKSNAVAAYCRLPPRSLLRHRKTKQGASLDIKSDNKEKHRPTQVYFIRYREAG